MLDNNLLQSTLNDKLGEFVIRIANTSGNRCIVSVHSKSDLRNVIQKTCNSYEKFETFMDTILAIFPISDIIYDKDIQNFGDLSRW